MFARLLLLFILVPLADLLVLYGITQMTHWTTTVAVVIASGIVGAWLAQKQWRSVTTRIRDQLVQNNIPSGLLTDGGMILFAAGLLITPGLITDLLGLSLLIPKLREIYKKHAIHWLKINLKVQVQKMQRPAEDPDVVDGEVVSTSQHQPQDDPVQAIKH